MRKNTSHNPRFKPEIHVEIELEEIETAEKDKKSSISQAVAQTGAAVVAMSPAMTAGSLYQTIAQATSLSAQNVVNEQKQLTITQQTNTNHNISKVLLTKPKRKNSSSTLNILKDLIILANSLQ